MLLDFICLYFVEDMLRTIFIHLKCLCFTQYCYNRCFTGFGFGIKTKWCQTKMASFSLRTGHRESNSRLYPEQSLLCCETQSVKIPSWIFLFQQAIFSLVRKPGFCRSVSLPGPLLHIEPYDRGIPGPKQEEKNKMVIPFFRPLSPFPGFST